MSTTTYAKENENVKEESKSNSNTGTPENTNENGSSSKEAQEAINFMREQTAQADAAKMAFERNFYPEDGQTYRYIVDQNRVKLVDNKYRPGKKKLCFTITDPETKEEKEWAIGPEVFKQIDPKFKRHNATKAVFDITRHGIAYSTSTTYEIEFVERIS